MDYQNKKFEPGDRSEPSARKKKTVRVASVPTVKLGPEVVHSDLPAVMKPREGNKYNYRKTIGRGGMKMVLQVYDNDTMRDVAMALLPDVSTRSRRELEQFLKEARITASLEHPNIVPVHDIGVDSAGSPFFTMKLISGETLASVLKRLEEGDPEALKNYSFETLMRIYQRICNGMAFAHSKGVIHLDLKPENIQIGEFGEVLILDWGLARKIRPQPLSKNAPSPQATQKIRSIPPDEEVKGTPGYMAPEQIEGKNKLSSYYTDIYALGGILYAMVTFHDPVKHGDIRQMLRDTLSGNIERPSRRVNGREIPYGIEAVILKAMSLDPKDRYYSVRELRDEVVSFIDGFATKAEKAGPVKRAVLFAKRHKRSLISGGVILILSLLLSAAFLREAYSARSSWIPVCDLEFSSPEAVKSGLSEVVFRGMDFQEQPSGWKVLPGRGINAEPLQWMWFRDNFPENVKVRLIVSMTKDSRGVEICMAAPKGEKPFSFRDFASCSFWVEGHAKYPEMIFRSPHFFAPELLAVSTKESTDKPVFVIEAAHEDGGLILRVNNRDVLKAQDPFSLKGNGPVSIGVRSIGPGVRFSRIMVYRLATPERTTPLLSGETLQAERLYERAVNRFLMVEENHPGGPLASEALTKAYLTAVSKLEPGPKRDEYCLEIKKRIARGYPKFNLALLMEADACAAWENKDYALAVALMRRIFETNPDTRVVSAVLSLPHSPLPPETATALFSLIRCSREVETLDLSNYGLTSLWGLSGMRLRSLDCSGNELENLDGLKGMPLLSLNCSRNKLSDLGVLKGMRLRFLDCSSNGIRSFDALDSMPLERLNARGNPGSIQEILPSLKHLRVRDP